jgi:hypothetical protein
VAPQPESWTVGFLCLQNETQFCALLCIFSFDKLFRVFDGSIVMVLATKGICRCCFVVFKILVVLSGVVMRVSEPWKSLPLLSPRSLFCVCVCVCVLFVVAWATGFRA